MKSKLHALAGGLALLLVSTFWVSTLVSELFGSKEQIICVKSGILYGMFLLIALLAITGGSGALLGKTWKSPIVAKKKRRMKFAAANGFLILLPSAIYLADRAVASDFGTMFVVVQLLEVVAGAVNISLLALNMKDGLKLSKRK